MTRRRTLLVIVIITLALSSTVVISWYAFGRGMPIGHPFSALARPWIYVSQALMAAAVGFLVGQRIGPRATRGAVVLLVLATWIGELILLTVFGTFVANELTPVVAWYYWLMATGGLIQPIAASVGGVLGWHFSASAPRA